MGNQKLLSHVQVITQLLGVGLCCYPVGWVNLGSTWWLLLCLLGSILGLWVLFHNPIGNFSIYPELKPNAKLIITGPYKWIRHPMYGALIVMMFGIVGYNGSGFNLIGLFLVILAVVTKAIREEKFLLQLFPKYFEYSQKTKRFIPFVF